MRHSISGGVVARAIVLFAVLASGTGCDRVKDLPIAKQYTAKYLCSFMFNSNMDQKQTARRYIAPKVQPFPLIWDIEVNETEKSVTVGDHIFLNEKLKGRAVYRDGMGCTLLLDQEAADLADTTITPLTPPPLPADQPWPLGSGGMDTSDLPNLNTVALEQALDLAFEEPETYPLNTSSLLVAYNGKLIAERYGQGANKDTRWIGWSMTKTLTVTLLGILWDRGLVELDAPAPIPGWQGTEKEAITLRDIIHMTSGLEFDEEYGGSSGVTDMLYKHTDQAAYAASRPLKAEPGTVFNYSTGDTALLAKVIHDQTGGTAQSNYDFYQKNLFHKLGIDSAFIETDTSGMFVGGAYGFMTPRDWLRMGQLYLQQGNWQGSQVVSPDWIDFVTTPSPTTYYYGGQLWLNNRGSEWPALPADAFYFAGHQGQIMMIIPSENLVVLRTGVTERFAAGSTPDIYKLEQTVLAILEVIRNAR